MLSMHLLVSSLWLSSSMTEYQIIESITNCVGAAETIFIVIPAMWILKMEKNHFENCKAPTATAHSQCAGDHKREKNEERYSHINQ